jgi:glycogen synthase
VDSNSKPIRKVLMTADTVGGVWTYALELAAGLGAHGVEVHLATMGSRLSASQRDQAQAICSVQVHESELALEWMEEPWADVERAGAWLLELGRRVQPDVIHLNNYCHGHLPFSAPVLMVGHSCVLSWWEAVLGEPAPSRLARYQREVARGLHSARKVVAPSAAMLDALRRHYGALPDASVIPNGRGPEGFAPAQQKQPVVLCAGRLWDRAKNVTALTEVAPELPWTVEVAGETQSPEGRSVRLENVRALGKLTQPELAEAMSRASIYALPARYEPFGLSVLEAALSGCALVLGDIPSLREIWGQCARFVPPDDRAALVRAIRGLVDEPLVCRRLAHAAQMRAQLLSASRMVDAYLGAYAAIAVPEFFAAPREA